MARDEQPYEFPVYEIARRRGRSMEAGLFHLAGRIHFAAYGSEAARELVEMGALHVARLCFDRDPWERTRAGHQVRPIAVGCAAARFAERPREN
jgi:hypothetical protein